MKNIIVYDDTGKIISGFQAETTPPKPIGQKLLEVIELPENLSLYEVVHNELVLRGDSAQIKDKQQWEEIDTIVAAKLLSSDWTQLDDTNTNKVAWADYRKQLRSIRDVFDNPNNVLWPSAPETSDSDLVNFERQRRIVETVNIFVADYSAPIAIKGDDQTRSNLQSLASRAQMRIITNDESVTVFRDENNIDHELTPSQVVELGVKMIDRVELLFKSSWSLKAMPELPRDYTDNKYWQ